MKIILCRSARSNTSKGGGYRDEYYNKETEDKGIAEIIIKKHRNGPIGTVKLGCKLELSKFVNLNRNEK